MVEHANIIDTLLLHEPKGIKESESGQVYVSTVTDSINGPFTGEWKKLEVSNLDITKQIASTPTYQSQASPVTLTSSIVATTNNSLATVTSFTVANKNDKELYNAVDNLLTRMSTLEDTVSKMKTLTSSLDSGLKALDLFAES